MSTHTTGRITFKADGDANCYSILTEDGRWLMAVLTNGEQTSERQIANFRRLATCWNACEGIRTDALEHRAHLLKAEDYQIAVLTAQRDRLLGALKGRLEVYGGKYDKDYLPKHETELELINMVRASCRADKPFTALQ